MKHLNTKLAVTILGSVLVTSIVTGRARHPEPGIGDRERQDRDGQSLARTIAAMSVESMLRSEDTEIVKSQIRTAPWQTAGPLHTCIR